jgi:hypothetical protein
MRSHANWNNIKQSKGFGTMKVLSYFFRKKAASNVLAKTTKNEQSEQLLFSPA